MTYMTKFKFVATYRFYIGKIMITVLVSDYLNPFNSLA